MKTKKETKTKEETKKENEPKIINSVSIGGVVFESSVESFDFLLSRAEQTIKFLSQGKPNYID